MNSWLFEWGPGAGALGVVVGCARHGLPLTTIYYRELHKCIEKRDKLNEISMDICTFQLNPNFPLLFSILGRYIEIFGQVSINWNQTDVQKLFQELIEAIHITVNSRIEFYTKWIYYPIECHANDWKEYL